jgi:hypothetical protein
LSFSNCLRWSVCYVLAVLITLKTFLITLSNKRLRKVIIVRRFKRWFSFSNLSIWLFISPLCLRCQSDEARQRRFVRTTNLLLLPSFCFSLRLSFSISSFNGSNNNNSFLCVLLYVNLFCQSLWICLFDLRSFIFSHRSPTIVSRTFSFKFLLELICSHVISSNFFDDLILCSRSLHNNQIKKLKIRFMKNVKNI